MDNPITRARALRRQMTNAETILWTQLRGKKLHGRKIRRQHPIGPYIADFACVSLGLVIEIDGATHGTAEEIARDRSRDGYLRRHGFRILRFGNDAVYECLDRVVEAIASEMESEMLRRQYAGRFS
jgi:very-short-patch-repair endonuclease